MPVENFEASPLFPFVGVLIRKQLLLKGRGVEVVIGNSAILKNDGHAIVPAAFFGGMEAGLHRANFEDSTKLHFLFEKRVMIFLEQGDELVGVTPLGLVVVLRHERFIAARLTNSRG